VLPVAGILLGVGSANLWWLPDTVSQVMAASGSAIFGALPLLFAIGVAIGLAKNDGVSALAATVGYFVLLAAMGTFAKLLGMPTATVMGIPSVETGVFGGIIVGLIAAAAFNGSSGSSSRAISASLPVNARCRSSPRLRSSSSVPC
jgi:PTS system glucose-specific IIC component